jgi:hypothetical protein
MADLLADWATFICSPEHAGRFLCPVGDAEYTSGPALTDERIQRFCDRLGHAGPDAMLLARLYLLLGPDFAHFFSTSLPALLRAVSHSTAGTQELSRRGVRGKVLWPQTLRARASGKATAGSFFVRRAERSSDVPENQLLRLFLTDVVRSVDATAKEVGTGAVLEELKQIRRHAITALRNPYLKEVAETRKATALMRRRARRHRNRHYRPLTDRRADFDAAIRDGKWATLYRLLRSGWFKPVNREDLFELYLLVLILDVLANDLGFGDPVEYGLIRPNREHVAWFSRADGAEVWVYFDQSPKTIFGTASIYGAMRGLYTFPHGSERRPDIVLRARSTTLPERRLLVEAKETADDEYMRGSVYKVFGYLYDFRAMWDPLPDQAPKAVLVFPEKVALRTGTTDVDREVVLASGELSQRGRIVELLKRVVPD